MIDGEKMIRWREREWGALFVILAILVNVKWMGPVTTILSIALLAAYVIWIATPWRNDAGANLPLFLVGIAAECLHFGEEYLTGFQRQFPKLLEYEWSDQRFVLFNLIWLAIFVMAALGVFLNLRLAYLVVFFFVLGGEIGNGIGHLVLSVTQRRYFPGSFTAPVVLLIGVALLRRLYRKNN